MVKKDLHSPAFCYLPTSPHQNSAVIKRYFLYIGGFVQQTVHIVVRSLTLTQSNLTVTDRTKVVSKKEKMVRASMKLWHAITES